MSKKSYSEKLRDPRWQRKRLQILERDNFTCGSCGDKTSELHVHHREYESGGEPWDGDDRMKCARCKACHDKIELSLRFARRQICDPQRAIYLSAFVHLLTEKGEPYAATIGEIVDCFLCDPELPKKIIRELSNLEGALK